MLCSREIAAREPTKSREYRSEIRSDILAGRVSGMSCFSLAEFSEDRRKTSRGICLSNLTEPTKPVVYTDRDGVAGRYPPTNYSLLFILFTRMRADALPALIYEDPEQREREREREREGGGGERKTERCSHKSKFHFNVLTKDQIKHFNWRFYGGRQPKSNSCLHPTWPCRLVRSREYACTRTTYPCSPLSRHFFLPSPYFPRVTPSWSRKRDRS